MFLFGIALNLQNKDPRKRLTRRLNNLPAVRTRPSSVSLSATVVWLSSGASILLVRAAHVLVTTTVVALRGRNATLRATSIRHATWSSSCGWLVLWHRFCRTGSAVASGSTAAERAGGSRSWSVARSLRLQLFPKVSVRSCDRWIKVTDPKIFIFQKTYHSIQRVPIQ